VSAGIADAVLFDLDGTLADTAPDLIAAANRLRKELGRAPVPELAVRNAVSKGGAAMLRAAFTDAPELAPTLLDRYLALYRERICVHTRLFEGMDEVLDRVEAAGRPWGIVTNKPGWLTTPLVAAMGLDRRAGVVVSGDTLAQRKPAPEPVLHACKALGIDPVRALMVGDDRRDIEAAHAAGAASVLVDWGYYGDDELPGEWGAQHRVAHPARLLALLGLD
jgi:phosphoglycolate phosphatase